MISEAKQRLLQFFLARMGAYSRVFAKDNADVDWVLRDLAKFCRANESTFHLDARAHAVAEGRREVWLRIMHHLKLDPDQFWKEYGREEKL